MARKSAHGKQIGQIEYLKSEKAYFEDGTVLKNIGFGWKLHGTVKEGLTPEQAFLNAKANQQKFLAEHPAYEAYEKALHDICGQSKRWRLDMFVSANPQDPDGVHADSTFGWEGVHASFEEIQNLCKLYLAKEAEAKK